MKSNIPKSGSKILSEIASIAFETDSFPDVENAKERLNEENIDTSGLKTWASETLLGVKARQKLEAARSKRLGLLKQFEQLQNQVTKSGSELRSKVFAKLQLLANSSPEAAQVYCRKFEETPDEDLPDLEAELMMLDVWEDDQEDI